MNYSILKSRTFWTIVATIVVVDGNIILPLLPASIEGIVVLVLGGIATYFHVNPSQTYNPPQV